MGYISTDNSDNINRELEEYEAAGRKLNDLYSERAAVSDKKDLIVINDHMYDVTFDRCLTLEKLIKKHIMLSEKYGEDPEPALTCYRNQKEFIVKHLNGLIEWSLNNPLE